MTDQPLIFEKRPDGVAVLRLNRPDIHNAFDEKLIADLSAVFKKLAQDDSVRVLLLTSEGKSFSAGADLDWMRRMAASGEHENFTDALALTDMMEALDRLPMPVVARVQGAAMGGGVGLVACCDIAIAADSATFAFSEVRLGIIPAAISPYAVRAIGTRQARRYFLTGERFDAATALRLGLVHEVVPADRLDATVDGILDAILKSGPEATRAAKDLVHLVDGLEFDGNLRRETALRIGRIRASKEGREGLSAFLEKRKPAWVSE
ncbi:enoyl-CoA hydratase/isomerase family protein [Oceanibaculum sp.]|uniref:enoyl-CoA hydratase/isomerase family protein n=1 Tax=Oceanibaculum sp. TaxID=1903597 RepID=UPI0025860E97|nr:enoyl-CoA hydratase/isomerase family protein [Oceanibaculum sp.]MCH2395972.1 enoyl-CoA hydratase/isomerase family protein [Oceanibaculum sp.]